MVSNSILEHGAMHKFGATYFGVGAAVRPWVAGGNVAPNVDYVQLYRE